jgi:hypothetical protein
MEILFTQAEQLFISTSRLLTSTEILHISPLNLFAPLPNLFTSRGSLYKSIVIKKVQAERVLYFAANLFIRKAGQKLKVAISAINLLPFVN